MTYDLYFGLAAFAFVSSGTPGPNNLMLMASGANFGFRRTLPHMFGVAIGFSFMVGLVGLGLMGLFDLWPPLYTVLKVASVAYLLYLAWKLANAAPMGDAATETHPMSFFQAALFQWVNPKAWAMALTAISVYAPGRDVASVLVVAAIFGVINLPTVSSWTVLGQQMRRILRDQRHMRIFNIGMALLLVGSLAMAI
jgi:threonine/homoserine/homoserine lactone efflux protein